MGHEEVWARDAEGSTINAAGLFIVAAPPAGSEAREQRCFPHVYASAGERGSCTSQSEALASDH